MANRKIPSTNGIFQYLHCARCIRERPPGESPESYSRYSVGMTPMGLQVWCRRHDVNMMHIDFAGQKFHSNNMAQGDYDVPTN